MQHDRLTKYETESNALPRQNTKSLSQLPKPRSVARRVFPFIIFAGFIFIAVGIWLYIH